MTIIKSRAILGEASVADVIDELGRGSRVLLLLRHSERPKIGYEDKTFGASLPLTDNGKRCRRTMALKAEIAPMVRSIASRYNSIRIGKKTVFNSHDLRTGGSVGFKGCPTDSYFPIAYEDESCYLVKCSPSDETIYYDEYEWMREPIPFASDIRHYIALRYQAGTDLAEPLHGEFREEERKGVSYDSSL